MTADRIPALLEPIQKRLNAATPGPWFREYGDVITNEPDPRDVEEGYDDPRSLRIVRAAPHLAKREPQGIRNADFIANARTDQARLLAAVQAVTELAANWEARGEHDMAYSKTIPDEDIAMALLTDGATMVENARHIRNALEAALGGEA